MAIVTALLRLAFGEPLDRRFVGGLIGGAVVFTVLAFLMPLFGVLAEKEGRMWKALGRLLRRSSRA
jgi:hypothetical protein